MGEVTVDDAVSGGAPSASGEMRAPHHEQHAQSAIVRTAFVGPGELVDRHAPSQSPRGLAHECFPIPPDVDPARAFADIAAAGTDVTVIFRPVAFPTDVLRSVPGITLGVLDDGVPESENPSALETLDRIVSFEPALTGASLGGASVWRAIPPPVRDEFFGDVRALHRAPLVMSIGRSTAHREAMLIDAKHEYDLLQVIHGVEGDALVELLREYDVGIHIAPDDGGGFGGEVALHLAAGQLLLSEPLEPARGLEPDIDYLRITSPEALVSVLERLARFPEMHQNVRVRGRLKAEQFRASRVFARIVQDLLLDVAAFGRRSS